jgi:hypothetical protein
MFFKLFSWFPYQAETETYSASKPGAGLVEETELPREQLSRELKILYRICLKL